MHDFGANVNLKGKHAVFKKTSFYRPGANRNTRTFVIDGGPGCEATKGTQRTLTGYWLSDSQRDTINSYELELYIDENGKDVPNPGAVTTTEYTPPLIVIDPAPIKEEKTASTKLQKDICKVFDVPAEIAVLTTLPIENAETQNKVAFSSLPASNRRKPYDTAKAVELYKQGMKIVDIAVEMGYARGQGQNRTRAALREAGVLK